MFLIEKITFFLFFLSALNVIKHTFNLITEIRKDKPEEIKLSNRETFLLGLSISFILTIIFTGF
jgi:hypothetical protein